jgi:WhiB family redox-sensing transcriptional regulator
VRSFFDIDGDAPREQRAKALCGRCPVMEICRKYAVTANEPYGIWGGLNPRERDRMRWVYRACTQYGA